MSTFESIKSTKAVKKTKLRMRYQDLRMSLSCLFVKDGAAALESGRG